MFTQVKNMEDNINHSLQYVDSFTNEWEYKENPAMKIQDVPTNEYIESLAVKIGQDPYHVDQ